MNHTTAAVADFRLASDRPSPPLDESQIYAERLPLVDAHIIELGCGAAQHTRAIAQLGHGVRVTALEVDRIQLDKNLAQLDLPNVTFKFGGAEAIPERDGCADAVVMFKSLHHVPPARMGLGLREIHRVLKPGGLLYVSEPIFAGAFNDILKLFHDEQAVRLAAFTALGDALAESLFELEQQVFFSAAVRFTDFADFEQKIIRATHSEHVLDESVYREVKRRMENAADADGIAFDAPMRVDLLRKPAALT